MLREINQIKKDKYFMLLLICGILKNKNKWTNIKKKNRNTVIDTENKQVVTRGDRLEGRKK